MVAYASRLAISTNRGDPLLTSLAFSAKASGSTGAMDWSGSVTGRESGPSRLIQTLGPGGHVLQTGKACCVTLMEQLAFADVAAHHGHAAVAGLLHDVPLGRAAGSR